MRTAASHNLSASPHFSSERAGTANPAHTGHRSGLPSHNHVPSHSFGSYAQSPRQSTDPSSSLGTAENPVENQRIAYSVRPSAQACLDRFLPRFTLFSWDL